MNSSCLRFIKALLTFVFALNGAPALAFGDVSDFSNRWSGDWSRRSEADVSFLRLTTAPADGPSYIAMDSTDPVSMQGYHLRLRLRINRLESWQGIELRISEDASMQNYFAIAIPFYSDAEFNFLQSGQWADLTLSLGEARVIGKPDINNIRHMGLYVAGRTDTEDAFIVDIQSFTVEESVPTSIVSMTFDDGYDDHFRAAEIMSRYGLRGTAYIMTNEINQDGYLTSDQLLTMFSEFGWSISAHHKIPITNFTLDELAREFSNTFDFLQKLGLDLASDHFAYPLGKQNRATTLPLIRDSFSTARIAGGGAETLPPSDWHMLRTFNVTPDITPEVLQQRIQKAVDHNEWLILMFHYFTDDTPENDLTIRYSEFEKFWEVIERMDVRVHPVDEVYGAFQ